MSDARSLAASAPAGDLRGLLEGSRPPEPVSPRRGYWIYGAGGFGRQLARELIRLERPVLGFIDRKGRELREIDGLTCLHPDELTPEQARGAHYVHGIMNYAMAPGPILDWAEDQPFDAIVFPAGFYGIEGFTLDSYWLAPAEETITRLPELQALFDRLEDEESRTTLVELLRYRLSSDPRLHPAVRAIELYAERFLPIFDEPITFIDAGAYTGDSFEALSATGVRFREWLAFEPDPENALELRRTASNFGDDLPAFTLVQAGLANVNGRLSFLASGAMSSRLAQPGEAMATVDVEVLRFDDNFKRSGPIYVKMDIEGAEQDALLGMSRLLAEQRPVLAISAYHRTADLWEIPELVRRIYPDPVLRLRQHCHHGFETVLYVSPR